MHKEESGFTLVEIMAALAILGLALFMLLQAHYAAMRLFGEVRNEALVRELVTKAVGMAELEIGTGKTSGSYEFGKRYPDYKFNFEVMSLSEEAPGLVRIHVVVEGPDLKQEASFLGFYPGLG